MFLSQQHIALNFKELKKLGLKNLLNPADPNQNEKSDRI
jgi:hypothetical protein